MTFLQPALLFALPLAALPIVIHLIHLYRRRQIPWAAMIFLRAAQRMNKGLSRLRQVLILAFRVLAVFALLLVIARPLAGGWLGLTGGAPDTVLILLDRSASMEQSNTATGLSKRAAGLRNVAKAINDAVGTRSRLVLIDSTECKAQAIEKADALLDLPQTEATDTGADVPALLQAALDYITANKTGRTDIWMISDVQQEDWNAAGGRWEALRGAYATLPGVRFHLLCYPQTVAEDMAVRVDRIVRRETSDKAELLFDLRLSRRGDNPEPVEVPLRFAINGTTTVANVQLKENQLTLQAFAVSIDKATRRGWGRVEIPADAYQANNTYHFVFDEPPPLQSVIISDDDTVAEPLKAALSAPADPAGKYAASVLGSSRAAEISWDATALIVWQAPIPKPDEAIAGQLREHAAAGRSVLFLPPESPEETKIFGLGWGKWQNEAEGKTQAVEWWRNDADLLANTRDGAALPVGTLEISKRCGISGEGVPLARMADRAALLVRASLDQGHAYFLGTWPSSDASSLARDGVVMFAVLHRALNEAADTLGKAQQRIVSAGALGGDPSKWRPVEQDQEPVVSAYLSLRGGVVSSGDRMIALNRPPTEDGPQPLSTAALNELFAGLDFRVLTDSLEDDRSLTNEVWRAFLVMAAVALLGEALLCMPSRMAPVLGAKGSIRSVREVEKIAVEVNR